MTTAAEFTPLLRARVDWLSAKVANAVAALAEYGRACDALARTQGPRPWTAGQSWVQRAGTVLRLGGTTQAARWVQLDTQVGRSMSDTFGDMRDAARAYDRLVQEQASLSVPLLQAAEVTGLRRRGDALLVQSRTLSAQWRDGYAGAYDPKVTTDTDMWLRRLTSLTPLSRWQSVVPDVTTALTTGGGGSNTGVEATPPPPPQPGLPPWVAPVVGGILVVGVGYALYRYSASH